MIDKEELKSMLLTNEHLFNKIFIFQESFNIIPTNKHIGASIKYVDIKECRVGFIDELVNTIVDWIYSTSKSNKMMKSFMEQGRSVQNAASEVRRSAVQKFRDKGDGDLLQGQFGELLLFCFIQKFFGAVPILRKMPITTSSKHERFGADAIHYKFDEGKNIFYLGESKVYKSDYKFNVAFEDALKSILKTYNDFESELNLYVYEDFIDDRLLEVAMKYKNSELENTQIHLVNFVMYSETDKITGDSQEEIKDKICEIIRDRYSKFDNKKIDINNNNILKRITYIIFPVWELDNLLNAFAKKIGG